MTKINLKMFKKEANEVVDKVLTAYPLERWVTDGVVGWSGWVGDKYIGIGSGARRSGGRYLIEPYSWVGFYQPNVIWSYFYHNNQSIQHGSHFKATYSGFKGDPLAWIECRSEEDVPIALYTLRRFMLEEMMPYLDSLKAPRDMLDQIVDKEDQLNKSTVPCFFKDSPSECLMVLTYARVAWPARYPSLRMRYNPVFETARQDPSDHPVRIANRSKMEALLAYLDLDELYELPAQPTETL